MLAEAGIEPAPERDRKRTWKRFLKSHWETLYACDFFSVEVLGVFGTVRYMVFFVMEVKSRAVQVAGILITPDGAWMLQMARNLLDPVDGFLCNAPPVFTKAWTALLKSGGVKCVPIPAQSPNCNPHAERFVKTIRTECLVPQREILQSKFALGDQERPSGQQKAPEQLEPGRWRSPPRAEIFKDSATDQFLVRTGQSWGESLSCQRWAGCTIATSGTPRDFGSDGFRQRQLANGVALVRLLRRRATILISAPKPSRLADPTPNPSVSRHSPPFGP